jgi:hypothetical protein
LLKLEHTNLEVVWEFDDYVPHTPAGYLIKSDREFMSSMPVSQDSMFPIKELKKGAEPYIDRITIKLSDEEVEELIAQILQILPPINAETALYNPKVYMDCIPEISKLVNSRI